MASKFPRIPVEERARRYVALMEPSISGSNGHTALFNVVRALLHGFGFSKETARPLVEEFNRRCDPPWSESEINHKLNSVDGLACPGGRGHLLQDIGIVPHGATRKALGIPTETERKKVVEYDPSALKTMAGEWANIVDLVWLANRSAHDPATLSATGFLAALYRPGEKVLIFNEVNDEGKTVTQGEALWPADAVPTRGECGVWFLPQPVDGESHPNPRQQRKDGSVAFSRRSEESVREFRYMLLESDKAPPRDWLGFIVQVPLKIEALYTSGGRSIHALVRVDCRTKKEWDAEKQALMPFLMAGLLLGADRGTWSGVRLSRLPGCWREGAFKEKGHYRAYPEARLQKLLFLRPGADGRPICELPAVRDVERLWLAEANQVFDGYKEASAELLGALQYYSPVSELCREARKQLELNHE